MLERIRECLLDDAVHGELEARRQRAWVVLHRELDGEPCLTHPRRQGGQVAEARLGRDRELVVVAPQDAEQPAHLVERLAAFVFHGQQRVPDRFLPVVEHLAGRPSLEHHHAHVVRHHVVELARDPPPLRGNRLTRLRLSLVLEQRRPLLELLRTAPPAPQSPAQRPDHREDQVVPGDVGEPALVRIQQVRRERKREDRAADRRVAAAPVGRHRVDGDYRGDQPPTTGASPAKMVWTESPTATTDTARSGDRRRQPTAIVATPNAAA